MSEVRGRLITVEGVEGVGKSTNIEFIAAQLAERGLDVLRTREPGGTPLAERIRSLLLDPRDEAVSPMTELLLMFAARAQHVAEVIEPALAAGRWVICDRFTDSSYAYQGAGRGVPDEAIEALERVVLGGFEPDLTILLDLPVEEGMRRIESRSEKDRFEAEALHFFERVRERFLARARQYPDRIHVVSTDATPDEVCDSISNILEQISITK